MNKPAADPQAELRNANALYSLLENRYSKKVAFPMLILGACTK